MNDNEFFRSIQAPVSLATHSAGHSNALVENPFDDTQDTED
ncbi:streptamidine family RiPP [Gordonia rubripertincta]|jgi:hypothetical protein|uniref:Streptamidine family RiPP n=1 Tax=Gordonia rubripertincta TaxID=36822 RepID=A0ABT4MWK5_GORRU|nr:streptamidine family RiPP [Gordonia rubripertincta]MCZ4551357.1 streptamidine family RiPP [Gordonia rubripertincta]